MVEADSLKRWLRKNPQPTSLRIVDADDNARTIALKPGRNCWKDAEASVFAARAVTVEALDDKGNILRATDLEREGDDGEPAETAVEMRTDKAIQKDRRELAAVLDRYGDRLNEAFNNGAMAANTSHETLVGLVETLTAHLSQAIVNLHAISVQYAKTVQEQAGAGGDANEELLKAVLGGAAAKMMGGGGGSTNGKKEHK